LPFVFDRLRQAEGSNKRSGLGLGLAIARHIIDLHHGEITAESEGPGHGARFVMTLPLRSADAHVNARVEQNQNAASLHA
jgi:signal transduction histidine kinase